MGIRKTWQEAKEHNKSDRLDALYRKILNGEPLFSYVPERIYIDGINQDQVNDEVLAKIKKLKEEIGEEKYKTLTFNLPWEDICDRVGISVSRCVTQYKLDVNVAKKARAFAKTFELQLPSGFQAKGKSYQYNFSKLNDEVVFYFAVQIFETSHKFIGQKPETFKKCLQKTLWAYNPFTQRPPTCKKYLRFLRNAYISKLKGGEKQ